MDRLPPIPFQEIAACAQVRAADIVCRWLPNGRREGNEWVALNPKRADKSAGSFRINLNTGLWADFASSDARGKDVIALAQYIFDLTPVEAARNVARMVGHPFGESANPSDNRQAHNKTREKVGS